MTELSKMASTGTPLPSTADWLRQRFVAASNASVDGVKGFDHGVEALLGKPMTPAAVLVPVVIRETGLTVLLTQRTAHLRDHAGQISFPGGRREDSDATFEAAALREAREEVGLDPAQVEILGRLPDYGTATGFVITPVVGLVKPPLNLKLDDFEVAEVFEVPLDFLLDTRNHQRHKVEYAGINREYFAMPWEGYFIWGATAGMLVTLQRFLAATNEF